MSVTLTGRPVREPDAPVRAAAARRALIRWGLRLLRREWRQRVLIVALIAAATAAMILGIVIASATPGTPNAGIFGTSSTLVILPGDTRDLAEAVTRIEKAYGPASVIYDQTLSTGMAGGAQVRAQDPAAPYTRVLLALDSGRYPKGPAQAAVTTGLAQLYGLRIGSHWKLPATASGTARDYTVTGIVEDPSNLLDEFALVAPGQVSAPGEVRVFLGITPGSAGASRAGGVIPASATVTEPVPGDSLLSPATIVLVVSVLGLAFVALVATAAFTVMAQRRLRALGMLASLGATEADVRFVLIVDGALAGVLGAIIGAALGFGGWLWYYPHLETATAHRTDPWALPWWALITGTLLAVVAAVIAAARPGRAVSRVPVVAAISGRVEPPRTITRSLRPGLIALAAGLFLLFASGGWQGGGKGSGLLVPAGLIACVVACSLVAPFFVDAMARLARRAPVATRLALRDLERYRARSGAALAAVSFAVFLAAVTTIIASVRYDDALNYVGPNLSANQLVLYTPDNDPQQYDPGQFTPGGKLAAVRAAATEVAAALHAPAPLQLDAAVSPSVAPGGANEAGAVVSLHGRGGFSGHLFVATPALLTTFGISPHSVRPDTDILTMRRGLPGAASLGLVSGRYLALSRNVLCPAGLCIQDPVIQVEGALPSGTDAPNTVITEHAVRALGETAVPVGWLIQAPAALTATQVNAARQAALEVGATVESKSGMLGLSQISDGATAGGIAIALGVLAMTVGLIRAETAGDLRTLTATGAPRRTRRALTGVTAGVIALLGAVLGTVAAFLAAIAWAHSSLTQTFGAVPPADIGLLVLGMPLAAAAAGWLAGGRAPSAISRQPLE